MTLLYCVSYMAVDTTVTKANTSLTLSLCVASILEISLAIATITFSKSYFLHPRQPQALPPLTIPNIQYLPNCFSAALLIVLPPQLDPHC